MRITWNITKPRGNHRPVLRYEVVLEDYEKALAVPAVRVDTAIPKPPDPGWTHCWPGRNERGDWTATEFHQLMTPSHKTGEHAETLKLPWRADNAYPEVERAFVDLRAAFEDVLATSCASGPMDERGELESTTRARRHLAPAVLAGRFLQAVK